MPFRRQMGNSLRPVHRIKHVIDVQQGGVLAVQKNNILIIAKDAPVLANTTEVETGSKVNGIYLKVEVSATTAAALANFYLLVWKNPGGNIAAFTPNTVGANDNKRFVIHQEMVMLQKDATGNPRTVFNGVIVLPRGYRRFGPNDELTLVLFSPGVNTDQCFQCHYKEFR